MSLESNGDSNSLHNHEPRQLNQEEIEEMRELIYSLLREARQKGTDGATEHTDVGRTDRGIVSSDLEKVYNERFAAKEQLTQPLPSNWLAYLHHADEFQVIEEKMDANGNDKCISNSTEKLEQNESGAKSAGSQKTVIRVKLVETAHILDPASLILPDSTASTNPSSMEVELAAAVGIGNGAKAEEEEKKINDTGGVEPPHRELLIPKEVVANGKGHTAEVVIRNGGEVVGKVGVEKPGADAGNMESNDAIGFKLVPISGSSLPTDAFRAHLMAAIDPEHIYLRPITWDPLPDYLQSAINKATARAVAGAASPQQQDTPSSNEQKHLIQPGNVMVLSRPQSLSRRVIIWQKAPSLPASVKGQESSSKNSFLIPLASSVKAAGAMGDVIGMKKRSGDKNMNGGSCGLVRPSAQQQWVVWAVDHGYFDLAEESELLPLTDELKAFVKVFLVRVQLTSPRRPLNQKTWPKDVQLRLSQLLPSSAIMQGWSSVISHSTGGSNTANPPGYQPLCVEVIPEDDKVEWRLEPASFSFTQQGSSIDQPPLSCVPPLPTILARVQLLNGEDVGERLNGEKTL